MKLIMNETFNAPIPPADAETSTPFRALLLFTVPLASVIILQLFGRQVLLGGLAHQLGAQHLNIEEGLAAFVVAFSLAWVATSPVQGVGMLALAWGDHPGGRKRIILFSIGLTLVSTLALCILAFTDVGHAAIMALQGVSSELAVKVQFALGPLIFWAALNAVLAVSSNLLKLRGQSGRLAGFNLVGLAIMMAVLFSGPYLGLHPLIVVPCALLGGHIVRGGLNSLAVMLGTREEGRGGRKVSDAEGGLKSNAEARPPTWLALSYFYIPVMGNTFLMTSSKPLIQRILASEINPEVVLAGFGVAIAVSHVFYGWLNELRTVSIAFKERSDVRARIPQFALYVCAGMTILMASIFWTPLGRSLIQWGMRLEGEALDQAVAAMYFMVLGPAVVTLRSYFQGMAIYKKRMGSWLTSAMLRVGVIAASLLLLPMLGVSGAVLGVMALICGFLAEGLMLAVSLRGDRMVRFLFRPPTPKRAGA